MKNYNFLLITFIFIASVSNAQETPFYAGLGFGIKNYEGKVLNDIAFLPKQKLEEDSGFIDLYAGFHLNDFIALELGYANFESVNTRYILNPAVMTLVAPNNEEEIDISRLSLNGLFTYPISQNLSALALLGYSYFDLDRKLSGGFAPVSSSSSMNSAYYGLGLKYSFSDRYSTRLQWVKDGSNGIDIDGYRLSIEVAF